MNKKFTFLFFFFISIIAHAQYEFPGCFTAHVAGRVYTAGQRVSKNNCNWEATYETTTAPPSGSWKRLDPCGTANTLLGSAHTGQKRIVGYLPTWNQTYNFNTYDPTKITNVVVSFVLFKRNNTDFNSADFASISLDQTFKNEVQDVLVTKGVLANSRAAGTKVSVAVGGATDYAFLWLMNKYYNNEAKLQEIAQLLVNYANETGIDGIDLDLECWWADSAITGTTEIGGRKRGSKWGDPDAGPHPAAVGLTKLAQKIRAIKPSLILSAAVFGTPHFGNNYDDTLAASLDWLGLMTYDFTGSWNNTPTGPHSALYKVPLNTYPSQTADNPIYSLQDALEYWQGIAEPAWNHAGGFKVPRAKLCVGAPFYGYDFSRRKATGNGYVVMTYKDIVAEFPNAPTSYDALNPRNYSGHVTGNSKNVYYETPASIRQKYDYVKNYGHQGIIVWELTNDLPPNDTRGLLYNLNNQITLGTNDLEETMDSDMVYYAANSLKYNFSDKDYNLIEVYNLLSQKVVSTTIDDTNKNGAIPLHLPSGVYIVKWGKHTKKILVN